MPITPNNTLPIDTIFASFLLEHGKIENKNLLPILQRVTQDIRAGHSCTLLSIEEETLLKNYPQIIAQNTSDITPLVLHDHKLYMQRYFVYEKMIAQSIQSRIQGCTSPHPIKIDTPPYSQEIDHQKLAIFAGLNHRFSIITGGPGTGKTTTIVSLIHRILQENPQERIVMCAPTGKAQARMKESILEELAKRTDISDDEKTKILPPSMTIHLLLKMKFNSTQFRYNQQNLLPYDTLIIDECSMISLAMMAKLLDAIPLTSRVIFLGDKDQLPSVEAGSILADICDLGLPNCFTENEQIHLKEETHWDVNLIPENPTPLTGSIIELQKNYRFKDDAPIGEGAKRIKILGYDEKQLPQAVKFFESHRYDHFNDELPDFGIYPTHDMEKLLSRILHAPQLKIPYQGKEFVPFSLLGKLKENPTPENLSLAFKLIDSFKILCTTNQGQYGVHAINQWVREALGFRQNENIGAPIMILENDHHANLFNGDIGMIWLKDPHHESSKRAYFTDPQTGKFREYSLSQLPSYQEVFAMTIHKSQGSGFSTVVTLLPPAEQAQNLSRELIYTALTRAKQRFYMTAENQTIYNALRYRTARFSGLASHFKTENNN